MREILFYFTPTDFAKYVIDDSANVEDIEEVINNCPFLTVPVDELNPNQLHINLSKVWFVAWVDVKKNNLTEEPKESNNF
jgi:hypothetical protein